jgi:hypothetical protein
MYFSLDRKVPKDQDCKSLAKYFTRTTEKIKLVPQSGTQTEIFSFRCARSYFIRQVFEVFVKNNFQPVFTIK